MSGFGASIEDELEGLGLELSIDELIRRGLGEYVDEVGLLFIDELFMPELGVFVNGLALKYQ